MLMPDQFSNFGDFLEHAFKVLSESEMKLLVVVLLLNWRERNDVFHGASPTCAIMLYEKALSWWKNILDVQSGCVIQSKRDREMRLRWVPPRVEELKLNCDGAANSVSGRCGAGAVVRNASGGLIGAVGHHLQQQLSPLAAELYAIKMSLEFVVERI